MFHFVPPFYFKIRRYIRFGTTYLDHVIIIILIKLELVSLRICKVLLESLKLMLLLLGIII